MEKEPHVVVIGATNLDIKGRPTSSMIPHTSNPGQVEISAGGVGRNIAENLTKLGIQTTLISALSKDLFSEHLKEKARESSLSLEHVLLTDKYPTGLFMGFIDYRGDLISAISDMSILEAITPEFLQTKSEIIKSADFVVMDADISHESTEYVVNLCNRHDVPVCIEPVSIEKANNILPFLDRLTMVTPNREEAEVLAGFRIKGARGVMAAGDAIIEKGAKYALITLGGEGVYLASKKMKRFVSSISTVVYDSVGAGDSLVAGTIYGLCRNRSVYESIRVGIACATLTLTTRQAVHPELSAESLESLINEREWQPQNN
ncbi:MAG: carbohydrate kinase family protein [Vulcanimicrobiota bacterium]